MTKSASLSSIRWLRAISNYRAIATGGPNFAYDLCVAKFRPEDALGLDLSCLRIALNGAEPVRGETLDRFTATFAPYGFDPSGWLPSYGLAEATLGVTNLTKDFYYYSKQDIYLAAGYVTATPARPREWSFSIKRNF